MGFSFRKSVKVGPVRLNVSKSGIGVSAGVKGMRVGVNAKGQLYGSVGANGVYYRTTDKSGNSAVVSDSQGGMILQEYGRSKPKMGAGKKVLFGIGIYFVIAGIALACISQTDSWKNAENEQESSTNGEIPIYPVVLILEAVGVLMVIVARHSTKKAAVAADNQQESAAATAVVAKADADIEDTVMQGLEKRIDKSVPSGKHYTMLYSDFSGSQTKREIELQGFLYENDKLYIIAWCYLRNAQRQFAVNRIVQLYDRNGTEIRAPETYFDDMYHETDEYKVSAFFETHFDELMPLAFLARADGAMRKNEREVIAGYVKNAMPDVSDVVLENHIKALKCEFEQFGKSLKKLRESASAVKGAVVDVATKMYGLKKDPDAMEMAAYQKIKEALF